MATILSTTVRNESLTQATNDVPYPVLTFKLDNVSTTDIVYVAARATTDGSNAEHDGAEVAGGTFTDSGGKLSMVLGSGTPGMYSATTGDTYHAVFVEFGSTYRTGWYRITSSSGSENDVTLVLDVTWAGAPSSALVSRPRASDISTMQGSASGGMTGNLDVSLVDEDDVTEGYQMYVFLEGTQTMNNEYKFLVAVRDGTSGVINGGVLVLDDIVSIRTTVAATIVDYLGNASLASPTYFYPETRSARGAGDWSSANDGNDHKTIATFTIQGGTLPYIATLKQVTDGIPNHFAVDPLYDAGSGTADTFQLVFKGAAANPTSNASQETVVTVVVSDSEGRVFQAAYTLAALQKPKFTVVQSDARVGLHTDGNAAYDEVQDSDIPVLKVSTASVPDGAVGSFSVSGNSAFGVGSTYAGTVDDDGGSARFTFTEFASQAQTTSGPGNYFKVGDYVWLGADLSEQTTVASIASDGSSITLAATYSSDQTVTMRADHSAAGHTMVTLKESVDVSSGAVLSTLASSGQLLFTENGTEFDVLANQDGTSVAAVAVWKFRALTTDDFSLALQAPSSGSYLSTVTAIAGSAFADNGSGKLRITVGSGSVLSRYTAGSEVFVDFADTYTDAFAEILAVSGSDDAVELDVDVTYTSAPSAATVSVRRLEMTTSTATSAGSLVLTWSSTKGLGAVNQASTAISVGAAAVMPTNTDLGVADGAAVLVVSSSTAVDSTVGSLTMSIAEHGTNTFSGFFDAADGQSKFMDLSFAVSVSNTLSTTAASISAVSISASGGGARVLRLWQDVSAPSSQTVFHLDYADSGPGGVYTSNTNLLASVIKGGGWTAASETTITSSEVTDSSYLQLNDAADEVELTGAALSVPTAILDVTVTADDALASGDSSTVTLSDMDLYFYADPSVAFSTDDQITNIPLTGADTDTTTWVSYAFTAANGHPLITTGAARQAKSLSITFTEGTLVVTLASTAGFTADDTVALTDTHANYVSSSVGTYTVASVAEDVSITLTLDSGTLTTAESAQVGYVELRDASIPRLPFTVTIGTASGDDSHQSLFDWRLLHSGGSSTLWLRLLHTTASTYTALSEVVVTLTSAAYTPDPDQTGGSVGSAGELWSSQASTQSIQFTNVNWGSVTTNDLSDKIWTNFGTGTTTGDSSYEFAHKNVAQTYLVDEVMTVTGVADSDDWKFFVKKITAASDWSDISEATSLAHDTVANAEDGVTFKLDYGADLGNIITKAQFTAESSSQQVTLVLDPAAVNDGDQFIMGLVTAAGITESGGSIANAFLRRIEVRYAGGLSDFTLTTDSHKSFPGAVSLNIGSVTAHNTAGNEFSDNDPANHNYDIQVHAALVGASNTDIPDTTAGTAVWQFEVLPLQLNKTYAEVKAYLEYLPDAVIVSSGGDLANMDKALYNTSNGMNFLTSNTGHLLRVCVRVSLRRANAEGVVIDDADNEFVSKAFNLAASRTSDLAGVIQTKGLYGREVVSDSGVFEFLVGMGRVGQRHSNTTAWVNVNGSDDRFFYAFNNVPRYTKIVNDNNVIADSETATVEVLE